MPKIEDAAHIRALDGLRGLAALIVVISHCALAFFPYLHSGVSADLNADWQIAVFNSPFLALYSGGFSISVFFVLSGYVLSRKYFANGDTSWIPEASAKRYLRLVIPTFCAVMLCYILSKLGAFPADRSGPAGSITTWAYKSPMHLRDALKEGLYGSILLGHSRFAYVLWTLQIEFFGSIALFSFFALFGQSRLCSLYAASVISILLFAEVPNGIHYACFFVGAYLHRWQSNAIRPFAPVIFAIGLWLGGYHWQGASYVGVADLANRLQAAGVSLNWPLFIPALGATFLTWASTFPGPITRMLSARPVWWLGQISFSLYLTHSFVLTSVGVAVFRFAPVSDYQSLAWLATSSVLFVSLLVATPFAYFDRLAVRTSSRFSRWQFASGVRISRRQSTSARHVLAEGVGFEPTVDLRPRRFSRPVP